jgi:hypothetical protein
MLWWRTFKERSQFPTWCSIAYMMLEASIASVIGFFLSFRGMWNIFLSHLRFNTNFGNPKQRLVPKPSYVSLNTCLEVPP